jgi:hypothetical protein
MRFWTQTITSGEIRIAFDDGAMFVSVKTDPNGGVCQVNGNIPFKGINSQPVTCSAGEGVNYSALSPASPLDGITITHVAGNVDITIGF